MGKMTTDDKLLLADLERIAFDVELSLSAMKEYGDYEYPGERIKVDAEDVTATLTAARRASRELVTFRERLERRLRA